MTNDNYIQLKITGDGSHTLFVPSLNENYHSWHGAYTESAYVFIENGLNYFHQNNHEINVFELGFGTGLNAILSYQFAIQHSCIIHYTGIELHPVPPEIIQQLNYGRLWKEETLDAIFESMHAAEWNKPKQLDPRFSFTKIQQSMLDYELPPDSFDVVYFDAFAPEKQPELWSVDLLLSLYHSLKRNGVLVTYCAKGQFKRNLKSVGFEVQTLPGPPGKREMVRAIKST